MQLKKQSNYNVFFKDINSSDFGLDITIIYRDN